jgi:S-adenosylmethionine-diacylglycerol 3-amino-3-carboxypropyl transferase
MIDAPRFDRFDLVSLSNLFDWMDAAGVEAIARRLEAECRPGAVLLVRQLNNRAPIERLLPSFEVDAQRSAALEAADQSLFYERFVVLVKRGAQPRREP